MNGIFGRLPPCAINGFNYNQPPGMSFYNPEAPIYGKNEHWLACPDVVISVLIQIIFV